jgi:HlyD family secretion protein
MKTKTIVIVISAILLAVFIATMILRPPFLHPTLREGGFSVDVVEVGSVVSTELATGIVEPENEVLLLSPASSIILKIENGVGSKVQAGEAIIRLDPKPILNEIENIQDQLEMKKNNLEKTRLNARGIRVDLDYNIEVKRLKVASLKSELADQEQLLEVGGISPARHEKTKQELVLAEKDIETVQEKNSIRLKQLEAEEEGLKLQIQIQEKDLAQKQDLLSKMVIRAPSAGIVLEINGNEGEMVKTDQTLIRMSDLTTYKIRATIDDNQADVIKTGKDVYALIDRTRLQGKIGTISPVIRDKKIEFDVHLNRSDYSQLRPNLEVELHVVRAAKDSTVRLRKGPAVDPDKTVELYKVESGLAKLTEITIGLRGDEYIEIQKGAEPGDRLITSDIGAIRKLKEIEIKP